MLHVTVPPEVPRTPEGPHLVPVVAKSCGSVTGGMKFGFGLYQTESNLVATPKMSSGIIFSPGAARHVGWNLRGAISDNLKLSDQAARSIG